MRPALVDAAHALLSQLMLRRTKASVQLDLPPKTERLVFVPLSPLQHEAYKAVLAADAGHLADAGGGGGSAVKSKGLHTTLLQLRRVCNHPALLPEFDAHPGELTEALVTGSGKTAMLDKILTATAAAGEKAVVFSQWTETLDLLQDLLTHRRVPFLRLDGGTPLGRRKYLVARFSDPADYMRVLLCSTRAGGVGINLQAAAVAVMFDSDWNPSAETAKAHRG
eukprot:TRINITY_DN14081_c0_g1_i1.p1 TRINITY_DN14081_c0_g1~~TRINITY_DN14081_c0_g1_i1.p1  ORF type:complete len:223 (-),score=97.06 TRINITY_DN14081_c0_g1_i1:4-672(-)